MASRTAMKIQSLRNEGYEFIEDCVIDRVKFWRITSPQGRSFVGTIEEVLHWAGE